MITHEEARNELKQILLSKYDTLYDYISQQEKKDELLELYKEINNKRKELITLARHNTWSWELDIEIKDIQDKIAALEKKFQEVGKEE